MDERKDKGEHEKWRQGKREVEKGSKKEREHRRAYRKE